MNSKNIKVLNSGGIGVIPTDTVYGVVCSTFSKDTIERMYSVVKRYLDKPFIILISDISDLQKFGIEIDPALEEKLQKVWPGKVSVILPCIDEKFTYLHRGKESLAFRLPDDKSLQDVLKQTGPLASTSANPQGLPTAQTIEEAQNYFGDAVGFYVDGGELSPTPSTLISFEKGKMKILREGAVTLNV